jgi:hypothetical protein
MSKPSHEELLSMKANGECFVDAGYGTIWWPFCIVDGCTNRACLRLQSPRCYPHTLPGVPIVPDVEETETC